MRLRKKTEGLRPGGSLNNSSHFQWRSCIHPNPASSQPGAMERTTETCTAREIPQKKRHSLVRQIGITWEQLRFSEKSWRKISMRPYQYQEDIKTAHVYSNQTPKKKIEQIRTVMSFTTVSVSRTWLFYLFWGVAIDFPWVGLSGPRYFAQLYRTAPTAETWKISCMNHPGSPGIIDIW